MIRIDHPAKKNALSAEILAGLADALETAATDPAVRVVVLTAVGDVFCAGGDTNRMGEDRPGPWEKRDYLAGGVGRLARRFAALDKPVIAALNGPAVGAGVDLALWCDFRIAHPSAYLRLGFVDLGLTPGFGGAWLLTHLLGPSLALEILLTGEKVTAQRAADLGLFRTVTPAFDDEAAAFAALLAGKSSPAVRATKRLVQRAYAMDVMDSLDLAWASFGLLQETPEHLAATQALRARRKGRS
ncbi:enoyl-CoA hydratase/isomerase family protein [Asanoa iriomotensis]|uniref:enoyl-CoA hydratase/isomerase family protein n=1 Tax=Asanoa iriomotensis TaxID=234613 RepID=UPI0019429EDA|nr:enoyl-CoA hydratase-related protein [Asanoa iriomotensis]